ncbi:MAG: ROK family protein [Planctomycetes bacterium]|nr:ROK family protein [Planctomycetota bacterium]
MPEGTDGCWVGFDLGGTKMLATVYDDDFRPLGSKRRKTRRGEPLEVGLGRIADTIEVALKEGRIDRSRIRAIGVGCPGPLDLDRGVIREAPNLAWENVPVKEYLEKRFGRPAHIANDVDAGVYGEYRFGAGRDARCVVGIFPGTGIGGGCVYEGRILRGKTSSCMEIGHVQVMPGGPLCGCGQTGCLEAFASRLAISSLAAQAAFRGQAPKLREIAGTDLSDIRSGALAESVAGGDVVIEQILRTAGGHIGRALAGIVHLLAPDVVVLGGGLVEALPKLFCESVSEAADRNVLPSFRNTFAVRAASLGDDATVMGAAAWARHLVGAEVSHHAAG